MKMIKSVLSKLLTSVNLSFTNTIDEAKSPHGQNLHTLKRALPEGFLEKAEEERRNEGGSVGKRRGKRILWFQRDWTLTLRSFWRVYF
jgi:hypothetical protein